MLLLLCCLREIRSMRESGLERKVKKRIEEIGGMCLKWTSPGFTGVPDRIAFLPGGRVVFIELKAPGKGDARSPRQRRVASQLRDLGADVIVVDSLEELDEHLRTL